MKPSKEAAATSSGCSESGSAKTATTTPSLDDASEDDSDDDSSYDSSDEDSSIGSIDLDFINALPLKKDIKAHPSLEANPTPEPEPESKPAEESKRSDEEPAEELPEDPRARALDDSDYWPYEDSDDEEEPEPLPPLPPGWVELEKWGMPFYLNESKKIATYFRPTPETGNIQEAPREEPSSKVVEPPQAQFKEKSTTGESGEEAKEEEASKVPQAQADATGKAESYEEPMEDSKEEVAAKATESPKAQVDTRKKAPEDGSGPPQPRKDSRPSTPPASTASPKSSSAAQDSPVLPTMSADLVPGPEASPVSPTAVQLREQVCIFLEGGGDLNDILPEHFQVKPRSNERPVVRGTKDNDHKHHRPRRPSTDEAKATLTEKPVASGSKEQEHKPHRSTRRPSRDDGKERSSEKPENRGVKEAEHKHRRTRRPSTDEAREKRASRSTSRDTNEKRSSRSTSREATGKMPSPPREKTEKRPSPSRSQKDEGLPGRSGHEERKRVQRRPESGSPRSKTRPSKMESPHASPRCVTVETNSAEDGEKKMIPNKKEKCSRSKSFERKPPAKSHSSCSGSKSCERKPPTKAHSYKIKSRTKTSEASRAT